jgi:SAM-dependent methyltransferase
MKNEPGNRLPKSQPGQWNHAAFYWDLMGPPLRPSEQDTKIMQQAVAAWSRRVPHHHLKALMLGVTPQIATMSWPEGTDLLAVDRSAEMVRLVWPGDIAGRRKAECADWLQLPVRDASVDVIVGDGSFNCVELDYPEGFSLLAQSARRVLKRDGIMVMRFYARPEAGESPEAVLQDLTARRIETFDGFRLRLLMAVHANHASVRVHDAWQVWSAANIDLDSLISLTGWRKDVIRTISGYQGKETRYTFPTLPEIRATLSEWFDELIITVPDYPLGDRCPIIVFRPR